MAVIRAEGLFKVFGRKADEAVRMIGEGASREEVAKLGVTPAVIDAGFEVKPGEIFVVMGLSGSGKSTLIRMLNGLWKPTAGHVYIDDTDLAHIASSELRRVRKEKISMVFQHFALLPHRTVAENAAYSLDVQGLGKKQRRERALEALELVGLSGWQDKFPAQLSGGMKQRVGLARALAAGSDVMLMDEAFSALDPLIRREMQDQLIELQSRLGKTIVFITHDLNEAMRLGDRIAMMRDGRIVQVGTAEQVLNEPANEYVAQFVADVDRTRVLTAARIMEPVLAVATETDEPRSVLHTMREHREHAAFVTAHDRTLRGIAWERDVMQAANSGDATVDTSVDTTAPTVRQDTLLAELFTLSAESPQPLGVVDADGRLLGMIPRVTLLEAMANAAKTASDTSNGSSAETHGVDTSVQVPDEGGAR